MRNSRIACAAAVLAALAAAGPGPASASRLLNPPGPAQPVRAADPQPYAAADTAFGLDTLGAWCEREPQANLVLSPAGLASGLGMAYLGARRQTAAALAHVLHLPPAGRTTGGQAAGGALSTFVAGTRGKLAALRALDRPGVVFLGSDHVWTDPRLRTEQSYLTNVATAYRARVAQVPLLSDPESARRTINAAVGQETRGQISDLLPAGSVHGDGWVLTDASYLNADWARPFDHAMTAAGSFATAAGAAVRTQFLHGVGDYAYARADGWTAVSLPYRGGRLALVALLPVAHDDGCPAISPSVLSRVMTRLSAAPTGLAMPKVRLSSKADMAGPLTSLGMAVAFGPDADFRGISPNAGSLGMVEHAATLRVDEKGTQAAAATGIGVGVSITVRHRDVVFDRPYLLLVRDMASGEPLFLARVADPSGA